jgi:hypothetical protein
VGLGCGQDRDGHSHDAGRDKPATGGGRQTDGALARLDEVGVRAGLVTDDGVNQSGRLLADGGMQVEADDDRRAWSHERPYPAHDVGLDVVALGCRHGTVEGQVDDIEVAHFPQAGQQLVRERLVHVVVHRGAAAAECVDRPQQLDPTISVGLGFRTGELRVGQRRLVHGAAPSEAGPT